MTGCIVVNLVVIVALLSSSHYLDPRQHFGPILLSSSHSLDPCADLLSSSHFLDP